MTIEKFNEAYWSGNYKLLDDHMYFSKRRTEKPHYWREENDGKFFPFYSMNNFSAKAGIKLTPMEIEERYDSIDYDKYAGKKFTLGDYTFYGFASGPYKSDFYKSTYYGHAIYMEYHGYRDRILEAKRGKGYETEKDGGYSKSNEALDIFLQLLKDNPDVELVPCSLEEITGPLGFKLKSDITMVPPAYPQKKHKEYKWEGAGEKCTTIDLDHFIKMETKDGLYQPSASVLHHLFQYDSKELLKTKTKKIKDLGINKIQLRNNASYDVSNYYNLDGVEVKASKSVLKSLSGLRKYSSDEKSKAEIVAAEKAAEEAYKKEIHDDTYTLMQHGKLIAENIRSYDIVQYFENKENKDFEFAVIAAGKKCFEVAPDLNKIFFAKYGIYSYTELSGEKFADCENIEGINKLKDITIPKRLVTLISTGAIETPMIGESDKKLVFDKGATYIGAEKKEDGSIVMIEEPGDQGI
jgi:hypothetical protein